MPRRCTFLEWLTISLEVVIVVATISLLMMDAPWIMVFSTVTALLYVVIVFTLAWSGSRTPETPVPRQGSATTLYWSCALTFLASAGGIYAATVALDSISNPDRNSVFFAVAAASAVILSWLLLHLGFAGLYEAIDSTDESTIFRFPDDENSHGGHASLNYIYFSFVIGTTFATSDVIVCDVRGRRLVLLHSIISFFYNALIVAVAFQVLQTLLK